MRHREADGVEAYSPKWEEYQAELEAEVAEKETAQHAHSNKSSLGSGSAKPGTGISLGTNVTAPAPVTATSSAANRALAEIAASQSRPPDTRVIRRNSETTGTKTTTNSTNNDFRSSDVHTGNLSATNNREGKMESSAAEQTSDQPQFDIETLVVVSKLKAFIRERSGMNTSQCCIDALTQKLCRESLLAIERAQTAGRKTVMGRDIV